MEGKSGASSRGNSSSNRYIKVVAFKKLVGWISERMIMPSAECASSSFHPSVNLGVLYGFPGAQIFYLEKIRVFQAG